MALYPSVVVKCLEIAQILNSCKILNDRATWPQGQTPLSQDTSSKLDVRILVLGPVWFEKTSISFKNAMM